MQWGPVLTFQVSSWRLVGKVRLSKYPCHFENTFSLNSKGRWTGPNLFYDIGIAWLWVAIFDTSHQGNCRVRVICVHVMQQTWRHYSSLALCLSVLASHSKVVVQLNGQHNFALEPRNIPWLYLALTLAFPAGLNLTFIYFPRSWKVGPSCWVMNRRLYGHSDS